jgi:hypothetical protein
VIESKITRLLPVACIVAAGVLFASELMTIFDFTPPGGEALCAQGGSDRHSNAMIVLAVLAALMTVVAVAFASRPAAIAVAVAGGVALLVFLISDLRVVNAVGNLSDACGAGTNSFFDAKAVPQGGFWMEMIGSLALAIGGIALATMNEEQLRALRPQRRERPPKEQPDEGDEGATGTKPVAAEAAHATADAEPAKLRLPRRPRARQRG